MVTIDDFERAVMDDEAVYKEHRSIEQAHPGHPWGAINATSVEFTTRIWNDPSLIKHALIVWYLVGYRLGRQRGQEGTA